ncbi:MAG TPA: DUF2520 domain-containing protein [Burkholderiaceae bacterium]|nr:DUF2520 domain-containing protein [Burkholderiaceae bacterium]
MRRTLNIIGAGNVGKTLGRLWTLNQTFVCQDVLNRSIGSSQRAVSFIGAGRAIDDYADLRPADVWMIAAPDDQIMQCAEQLAHAGSLSAGSVVFHCSGALLSSELRAVQRLGAAAGCALPAVGGALPAVASIHPIRSFAVPAEVVQSFTGTWCGIEGDQRALDVLIEGFSAIGAHLVPINTDFKMLYHSAAVFASNYLVTLLDVALQAYAKAGISDDVALNMIEPLVRKTVDGIFQVGPEKALSGPIARGDLETAARQYRAVAAWDKRYGALYKRLGRLTADLAARRDKPKR